MKAVMEQYGDLVLAVTGAVSVIGLMHMLVQKGGLLYLLAAASMGL